MKNMKIMKILKLMIFEVLWLSDDWFGALERCATAQCSNEDIEKSGSPTAHHPRCGTLMPIHLC